jgi:integrase
MKTSKRSQPFIVPFPPDAPDMPTIKSTVGDAAALAATYAAAAQSKATLRSYADDIRHFRQHGGSVPATPEFVAEYLASFAGVLAVATLQHRLIAIHRAHTDVGLESPTMSRTVKQTMIGIRRTFSVKQRRVKALLKDDLLELMVHIDKSKPMRRARDSALILCGFAAALRRSEIVALCVEDITAYETGIELLIRRSKTDQEGAGRTVFIPHARGARCPVKALRNWLTLANISNGPVFRQISRHDQIVGNKALAPKSVALIVKAAVKTMSGVEAAKEVAGHSLRAGFCTEAAEVGMPTFLIAGQTGHKNGSTSLSRYIRPASQRKIPTLL